MPGSRHAAARGRAPRCSYQYHLSRPALSECGDKFCGSAQPDASARGSPGLVVQRHRPAMQACGSIGVRHEERPQLSSADGSACPRWRQLTQLSWRLHNHLIHSQAAGGPRALPRRPRLTDWPVTADWPTRAHTVRRGGRHFFHPIVPAPALSGTHRRPHACLSTGSNVLRVMHPRIAVRISLLVSPTAAGASESGAHSAPKPSVGMV